MIKIIDPSGWDFDRPSAVMVKVSSRGLIGADRSDFIKLAGHAFLDVIDNIKIADGEVPMHEIALGAVEHWGYNRNADGFSKDACVACHPTFQKSAKSYRNHQNRASRGDPFYGYVKNSTYNEDMNRVELLTMLFANKEAAARQGEHAHVADKEIEKLANGSDVGRSMACSIDHDICSGCQHKSKTRDEYCLGTDEGGSCKYGGCRNRLGKVADDGFVLGVMNPRPHWFDISYVFRPADRIAYGARADYLTKAASHQFVPGAEMAELLGITAPPGLFLPDLTGLSPRTAAGIKLAAALAMGESDQVHTANLRAFDQQLQAPLNDNAHQILGTPGTTKSAAALAALADRGIVLPLREFASWLNKTASLTAARSCLGSVHRELSSREDLPGIISNNPYLCAAAPSAAGQKLAAAIAPDYSLNPEAISNRAMRAGIRGIKAAAVVPVNIVKVAADGYELATAYALYQIAALLRIGEKSAGEHFRLTAQQSLAQNKIC